MFIRTYPIFLLLAVGSLIAYFLLGTPSQVSSNAAVTTSVSSPMSEAKATMGHALFKPYIIGGAEESLGLALDGGNLPLQSAEFPVVTFGAVSSAPLQLVLFVDWHSEGCRKALASIQQAYQSDEAAALPPLRLTLLPHVSTPESQQTHHLMIRVYSMTSDEKTFPALLRALCQEGLPPTDENITAFIEKSEPDLPLRMKGAPHIFDERIKKVFSFASTQISRNKSTLGQAAIPQLVAMQDVLTDLSSQAGLCDFIRTEASFQTAFISDPKRLTTIAPGPCCPGLGPHSHDRNTGSPAPVKNNSSSNSELGDDVVLHLP